MKLFKNITRATLVPLAVICMTFAAIFIVAPAGAQCSMNDLSIQAGANCARGTSQPANLFTGDGSVFKRITDIMLFIVGAVAVIMLIIGGIRYVVSGGDQTQVTAAKNTILYAIIGIVVAVLAYAAVSFVTGALLGAATGTAGDTTSSSTTSTTTQ